MPPTARTTLRRLPERGDHRPEVVRAILDEGLVAHVGFAMDGQPWVIPMTYARIDDHVYVHGSVANHLLRGLAGGCEVCMTVTLLDGLVLARSAFHHSMNYRSVVIFGVAERVDDETEKQRAFVALVDRMAPGRSTSGVRLPSPAESRKTLLVRLAIDEASAKIRTGPPIDDPEDLNLAVWAGVVPLRLTPGAPLPA